MEQFAAFADSNGTSKSIVIAWSAIPSQAFFVGGTDDLGQRDLMSSQPRYWMVAGKWASWDLGGRLVSDMSGSRLWTSAKMR